MCGQGGFHYARVLLFSWPMHVSANPELHCLYSDTCKDKAEQVDKETDPTLLRIQAWSDVLQVTKISLRRTMLRPCETFTPRSYADEPSRLGCYRVAVMLMEHCEGQRPIMAMLGNLRTAGLIYNATSCTFLCRDLTISRPFHSGTSDIARLRTHPQSLKQ